MKKQTFFLIATMYVMNVASTFADTIYIDPNYKGEIKNGTVTAPYNSWESVSFTNGNLYLQKRGTTYTSSKQILISVKNNIIIGAYGEGDKARFSYTGTEHAFRIVSSSYCTIENFEVDGNGNALALIGFNGTEGSYTLKNTINNCLIYNADNVKNGGYGIHGYHNDSLAIINTEIHKIGLDGIYLANEPNVEIGYCYIHDVNRIYFINPDQTQSSGDGIQLDGYYNGFHIHNTIIDRTGGAGNKFNLILASKPGTSDNAKGIIEYCTFKTGSNVATAFYIGMGNGIIIRYNIFEGLAPAIRLSGMYTSNNLIHNNLFNNCASGIGVAYSYPAETGGPCTGTKIYNNVFYHVPKNHIWIDKTDIETRNNIHVRTNDSGVAIYNYGGGSWKISNNCYSSKEVAGTPGLGTNSIIGDPLFVDPENQNFNLQENSPCINSGIDVDIAYDIDGVKIPFGTHPDIGAYEFMPISGAILIDRNKLKIYPNPSIGIFNIHTDMTGESEIAFEVRNLSSHLVHKGFLQTTESVINLTSLPPGMYFLSIGLQNNKIVTKKIIKT